MTSVPSTFRANGGSCSTRFESLPDISRKLDSILQLLHNNDNNDFSNSISRVLQQQEEILSKLNHSFDNNQVISSTCQQPTNIPQSDARSTILRNQQWDQSGFNQNLSDPITAMNNGSSSWNKQPSTSWEQPTTISSQPVNTPVNQPIATIENNEIMKTLEEIKTQLYQSSDSPTINRDLLQQMHQTMTQLVEQSNDNNEMIATLQERTNDLHRTIQDRLSPNMLNQDYVRRRR
jgi:hypothetical protein